MSKAIVYEEYKEKVFDWESYNIVLGDLSKGLPKQLEAIIARTELVYGINRKSQTDKLK